MDILNGEMSRQGRTVCCRKYGQDFFIIRYFTANRWFVGGQQMHFVKLCYEQGKGTVCPEVVAHFIYNCYGQAVDSMSKRVRMLN